MKGNYTKPMLTVEMFTMAQNTARDCADSIPTDRLTLADIDSCGWEVYGTILFLNPGPCDVNGEGMSFICYNNPSEGNYIFRS